MLFEISKVWFELVRPMSSNRKVRVRWWIFCALQNTDTETKKVADFVVVEGRFKYLILNAKRKESELIGYDKKAILVVRSLGSYWNYKLKN